MVDDERVTAFENIRREFERFSAGDTLEEYVEREIEGWKSILRQKELKKRAYTLGFIEVLKEAEGEDVAALAEESRLVYNEIDSSIQFCTDKIDSLNNFIAMSKAVTE